MEEFCKTCGHGKALHDDNVWECCYRSYSIESGVFVHCPCEAFVLKPLTQETMLTALLEAIEKFPDLADQIMTALRNAERHGPGCSCAACDRY